MKPCMLCINGINPLVPLSKKPSTSPNAIIQFGILRTVKSKKTERTVTSKIEKSSVLNNLKRHYFEFVPSPTLTCKSKPCLFLTGLSVFGGKNRQILAPKQSIIQTLMNPYNFLLAYLRNF